MIDLARLQQTAKVVHDENGNEYLLIPSDVYKQAVDEVQQKPQIERINAALDSWETEPDDQEWWAEFRQFLKDNPITLNPLRSLTDDQWRILSLTPTSSHFLSNMIRRLE